MATTVTVSSEFPTSVSTVHNDVVKPPPRKHPRPPHPLLSWTWPLVFAAAYNPQQQPTSTPVTMMPATSIPVTVPYMTNNNVVIVERVLVQPRPTVQPQIIYVNAQLLQQQEKKEESEIEQLLGCWCVLVVFCHLTRPWYIPLVARSSG